MNVITDISLCSLLLYSYHSFQARLPYTLKMDASGSSETLTAIYQIAYRTEKTSSSVLCWIRQQERGDRQERHSFVNAEKWALTEVGIFWDITPCSPLKVSRRFGGKCYLHFQVWKTDQARNNKSFACYLLTWLVLHPWKRRWLVPPKRRLTFNGLSGAVSQLTEIFKCWDSSQVPSCYCVLLTQPYPDLN
jgi:hypothetical protein